MLLNQFHDVLPGTSIEKVNTEAVALYKQVDENLNAKQTGYGSKSFISLPVSSYRFNAMYCMVVAGKCFPGIRFELIIPPKTALGI